MALGLDFKKRLRTNLGPFDASERFCKPGCMGPINAAQISGNEFSPAGEKLFYKRTGNDHTGSQAVGKERKGKFMGKTL